jgi:Ribonuclease G/E
MRVAAWDGTLHDYAIWRPGAPDGVGDLHRGRITARMPAMAGAFVALDGAEGFLPDSEGATGEGTMLGVRITRAAQGGKGPRLSARLTPEEQGLIGEGPPALLRRGPDALARLAAFYPQAPIEIDDAGTAARLPSARVVARAFDDAVESAIAAIAEPSADLPGGARLHVFPTPALTAIDVDLGSASAERRGKAMAQAEGNRALLPALARQIRLRNLSGAILVDLAGMGLRKRAALAPDFIAALAKDKLAPRFLGFSALGLAEILRPRIHPPLHELLAGPHAAGLAGLRALAREMSATPAHPPVLHARPAVAQALRHDRAALDAMAARAGRALTLIENPALPAPGWSL